MEMLKIKSYTDDKYEQQYLDTLSLSINPDSLQFNKGIAYQEDKQLGSMNTSNIFEKYKPDTLSFNFIIDCTGAVAGTKEGDKVKDKVDDVEKHLFVYNSDGHRPSFVVIAYGEMLFKGQLTDIKVNYTLFNNEGRPLRAEIKLEFSGFRNQDESRKKNTKFSPDMSRVLVMKESNTLAGLCYQIYGNALYVTEVARFNGLNGFRDIPAGTKLLFPPLKKQ